MERSWLEALTKVSKHDPALATDFHFNLTEINLNIVYNGLNRSTFPKTDIWRSPRIKWHRAGLGVWDFFMENSSVDKPMEDDIVTLVRETDKYIVALKCKVLEAHLQTKEELGELSADSVSKYSIVCGRALLILEGMKIQLKSNS
jgi:hypothetical protein